MLFIPSNLFRDYTEEEIIELIRENKVATYLIESNVPYDYIDELQYDAYLMTVSRGNIKIIKLLKERILIFLEYTILILNKLLLYHLLMK